MGNPYDIDFFGENKKRDSRRAFTRTQKNEILHQQNNKCGECHNPIDPREIKYHHGKAWSDGGTTTVKNGIAVCAKCHKILTHNQNLKKVEGKKTKRSSSMFDFKF